MSGLEDLIRETLVAHESEAPSGATLLDDVHARGRRRPRVLAAVGVAVAGVAATVGIITWALPGDNGGPARPLPAVRGGTPTATTFPLPSDGWTPGAPALDALAIGRFHAARRDNGQVCAWFGPSFRPVLWPQGYEVRLHPVQLIGPHGRVIARAGDVLSLGGGGRPAPAGTPCAKAGQWTWSVMSVPRPARQHQRGG